MAQRMALLLGALFAAVGALAYLPHDAGPKEHFLTDALLREVVERMGKDLVEGSDSYVDFPAPDPRLSLIARANKELDGEQYDYVELNPNPSIRDQEFLQHSTLWAQFLKEHGNPPTNEDRIVLPGAHSERLKPDTALPAYCNPPNPCPVGYTEAHGCIIDFENTAAFSREYQADQECMCDGEHMFECPGNNGSSEPSSSSAVTRGGSRLDRLLAQQLQLEEHKNLVAKKFHVKKDVNPYLTGEKLPVAAKKGINVDLDAD